MKVDNGDYEIREDICRHETKTYTGEFKAKLKILSFSSIKQK
jgi:hypothetical protein